MDKSLQKILGVEKVDDPMLPGTRSWDADSVIYVFLPAGSDPSDAFDKVTSRVDPPIPMSGSVLLENWLIRTPLGEEFYPLYFHGDVDGWRQQIETGATQLRMKMARVKDNKLSISDGSSFLLSSCTITLGGSPFALPKRAPR